MEVIADQLAAITLVAQSARETLPLIGTMPTDHEAFAAMTTLQRVAATAMLKEFEQLEGLLHGLFRVVFEMLGVRLKGLYPVDIANKMAELGILEDPARWVAIIKLRNDPAHEYPLGTSDRYDRFADALASFPFMFDAAERAERVIAERRLLESGS